MDFKKLLHPVQLMKNLMDHYEPTDYDWLILTVYILIPVGFVALVYYRLLNWFTAIFLCFIILLVGEFLTIHFIKWRKGKFTKKSK